MAPANLYPRPDAVFGPLLGLRLDFHQPVIRYPAARLRLGVLSSNSRGSAMDHDASALHISLLPNEIIDEIFQHHLPDYPTCPPLFGRDSPANLTRICGHWRAIAHANPRLWRGIRLELKSTFGFSRVEKLLQIAEIWLERSRPLNISVVLRCDNGCGEEQLRSLTLLIEHSSRWQFVDFVLPNSHPLFRRAWNPTMRLPPLVELRVISYSGDVDRELSAANIVAPRLRVFHALLVDDKLSFLLRVLREAPGLTNLWLQLWVHGGDEPIQPLALPGLKTLIIDSSQETIVGWRMLCESLVLPALRRFCIRESLIQVQQVPPGPRVHLRRPKSMARMLKEWTAMPSLRRLLVILPVNERSREVTTQAYRDAFPDVEISFTVLGLRATWEPDAEDAEWWAQQ
uniref:F-box domain-containing protein n=1 Tax=Mycena chlorophos TaxID=658473 RepID=A0ABQ0L5L7_MYCCL|nr:predicted protein [Mycena chlorophos]